MSDTAENILKAALKEGKPIVGSFVTLPTAGVAEVMALAGFDFLVIDTEHGPFGIETAENLVRGAQVGGAPAIVRVPDSQPATILKALDIGAAGVQVPLVNSAEDARRVVRSAKYHPEGARGMALMRSSRYTAHQPATYFERANAETFVVVHCETMEAVDNLPAILAVPGIDVVFVGPYDLSQSLGVPGQVNLPTVQAAINRALDTIIASPVAAGSHALSPAHARLLIQRGVKYITLGMDFGYLLNGCRNDLVDARRPEAES
jgi:4-hydroxy-2-oxoheptanedioate aldolase